MKLKSLSLLLLISMFGLSLSACEKTEIRRSAYPNGNPAEEYRVKEIDRNYFKDGKYIHWHENGQKQLEGNYKNNKLNGKWVAWYKSGTKRFEVEFENGENAGQWRSWGENGEEQVNMNYKNGKLNGIFQCNLKVCKILGIEYEYDCEVVIQCTFEESVPVGPFKIVQKASFIDSIVEGKFSQTGDEIFNAKDVKVESDGSFAVIQRGDGRTTYKNVRGYLAEMIKAHAFSKFDF